MYESLVRCTFDTFRNGVCHIMIINTQVRKLDRAEGRRNAELQQAYGEDLSQGLLKVTNANRFLFVAIWGCAEVVRRDAM